jgi:hypothetical protein
VSRKSYHEKMRPQLLAKYQLIDEEVRGCFGSKPQGNDSAFYQGCPECEHSDKCYEATQVVHKAIPKSYWEKANWRYRVMKDARGPYVHDVNASYGEAMSAYDIVKLLNQYEKLKRRKA